MTSQRDFRGEITVSSRIVDYLSSGLYESPAACLKELINNSYDADANTVQVFVKPDADRIIITDNGHGMDQEDFVRHFHRISESHKRDDSDRTPSGRKKIGKIGIGFIAANEICEEMEILSTKKGSPDLLRVTIFFDKMRQDLDQRRREHDEIAKADYRGTVDGTNTEDHFTHIFLKRVRGEARKILAGARSLRSETKGRSLYGLKPESVRDILADQGLVSWSEFDEYSQTLLRVAENVPVKYHDNWLPRNLLSRVRDFVQDVEHLNFKVEYDGSELRKPVVLFPRGSNSTSSPCFLRRFTYKGKNVSAKGYFYVQHGTIKPEELQGVLIRIRQAAVGNYDSTFLSFPVSEGSLIQRWISAELWVDDNLEDAMNIDRKTLRVAHPAYVELQTALHKELRSVISQARKELYEAGNIERKKVRTATAVARLQDIVRRDISPVSRTLAADLDATLKDVGQNPKSSTFSKRMSVVEFYEVVVDVARKTLPPKLFGKFLKKLMERLNR